MSFTAKDVQALRQSSGAGMMDCKKALEGNGGDIEAAKQWLREKGLAASAKRDDRDSAQGIVALQIKGNVGAIVKLKCETDFVAASEHFLAESTALVELVIAKGEAAVAERSAQLEDLKILLKEKIELGDIVRFEAASGNVLDSYIHIQGGRGVNGVLVEMSGATQELAHDIAVHIEHLNIKAGHDIGQIDLFVQNDRIARHGRQAGEECRDRDPAQGCFQFGHYHVPSDTRRADTRRAGWRLIDLWAISRNARAELT